MTLMSTQTQERTLATIFIENSGDIDQVKGPKADNNKRVIIFI